MYIILLKQNFELIFFIIYLEVEDEESINLNSKSAQPDNITSNVSYVHLI